MSVAPGFLAGSYDVRGSTSDARRAEILHALKAHGPLAIAADGPLTVATPGDAYPGRSSRELPLCALDGTIYNLAAVARSVELTPGAEAPQVILARAYARLGVGLLDRLRGDFALVVWDRAAGRGVIARDHLGGRGLVWHEAGGRLLFASELRQLLALLPTTPGPDRAALAHWVAISGLPGDHSFYERIRRLPAGHLIACERGSWEVRRFWQPRYRSPLRVPRNELTERLRETLRQAVARRVSNDGSTGLLLSGGLDSSTVAGTAAGLPDGVRPTRAYSATFPHHPGADESELIDGLCDAFGLTSTRAIVRSGSVLAGMLPYLTRWRLPPVSPNLFFWQPLLQRAAADGMSNLLDGEGGDEVFAHAPALIADRLRGGRPLAARRLLYRLPSRAGAPTREQVRRAAPAILRRHGLQAAAPASAHRAVRRLRGTSCYAPDWMLEPTARAFAQSHDPTRWKQVDAPRWWAQMVSAITTGLGPSLTYDHARRRTELAGLRAHHPLVDVDLVELMLTFPPELAFDPRYSRPLLREAMAGLVPDAVRLRPGKSSFDEIFHEALAGSDLPVVRTLLLAPDAELGAFVDLGALRDRLLGGQPPAHPLARSQWAVHVWRLVTAELWLRMLRDASYPRRMLSGAETPAVEVDVHSSEAPP